MLSTRIPRSWLDGSGTTRQVTSRPVEGSWPSTCQFAPCRVTWLCQLDRSVYSSADTFGRTALMHAVTAFSKSLTFWLAQPAVAQAVTAKTPAAVLAASRRRCTTTGASHRRNARRTTATASGWPLAAGIRGDRPVTGAGAT